MSLASRNCSVVIPTRGSDQSKLERAVLSALKQFAVTVEVIVVANGPSPSPYFADSRVRVIRSDPAKRGNGARNRGIAEASYSWVALLDDDDWWEPEKLGKQIDWLESQGIHEGDSVIVGCQLREVSASGETSQPLPLVDPGEILDAASYLFTRPGLRSTRPQLQTSTLLASTSLAQAVPFDEALMLHQDWDWVIRCSAHPGTRILHVHEPLTMRSMEVGRSVSSTIRWSASLKWASERLASAGARVRGDFALTVVAGFAASERDINGFRAAWRWAWSNGRPSLGAIYYFMKALLRSLRQSRSIEHDEHDKTKGKK